MTIAEKEKLKELMGGVFDLAYANKGTSSTFTLVTGMHFGLAYALSVLNDELTVDEALDEIEEQLSIVKRRLDEQV